MLAITRGYISWANLLVLNVGNGWEWMGCWGLLG